MKIIRFKKGQRKLYEKAYDKFMEAHNILTTSKKKMKHPKYYVRIKDDDTIATMCLWRVNGDNTTQISVNTPNNWTSNGINVQYCVKYKSLKYVTKREAKSLFPEAFK